MAGSYNPRVPPNVLPRSKYVENHTPGGPENGKKEVNG